MSLWPSKGFWQSRIQCATASHSQFWNSWKGLEIMCSWYTNPTCAVHLNNQTSDYFTVHRGVKQGSVLSPILFCKVMDKLLHSMCDPSQDLTLAGLSVGCSAHADDIRTCCVSVENINGQATTINTFVSSNSLAHSQDRKLSFFMSCTTRGIHWPSRPDYSDEERS